MFIPMLSIGQRSLTLYSGVNVTNTKYTLLKANVSDTASNTKENIILPWIGFDYNLPINKNISFTTGIGVSMMGNSNYYNKLDTSFISDPTVLNSILEKPHFKVTYLRIPIKINYRISKNIQPFIGYSFNYSIRKNQNFWAADVGNISSLKNIYRNYHHALIGGVNIEHKNLVLSANYHLGIYNVWDTEDFKPDQRAYLTLQGFQLSFGFRISE